jgi:nucleoredoxin
MKTASLLAIAALAAFTTLHAAPTPAAAPKNIAAGLKGDLVALEGKKVKRYDDTKLADKKYIAVYFSAHWCPPCRAFTPELVKWYNATKPANPHFELIFVSSDNTEKDMESYMAGEQMPWPALKFTKKKGDKTLVPYAGPGIPCLVLLDPTGKVLSHSYEGKTYVGPTKVMRDIDATLKANPATAGTALSSKP